MRPGLCPRVSILGFARCLAGGGRCSLGSARWHCPRAGAASSARASPSGTAHGVGVPSDTAAGPLSATAAGPLTGGCAFVNPFIPGFPPP